MTSKATRIGLVLLVLVMSACSKKSTTAPTAFTQTITGTVDVFGTIRHPVSIPQSGFLTLTLTWVDSTVDLNLYLTSTSCTSLYPKASCAILVKSETQVGIATEVVAQSVTSGQTFNAFVDNLSLAKGQNYSILVKID